MSNWSTEYIGGLAKINAKTINKSYPFQNIFYLETSAVTNGHFEPPIELAIESSPSRAKRIVRDNDILISTVRPNLKHFGFVKKAKENLIASTGFVVISPNLAKVDPYFLYCYISTDSFTNILTLIAENQTSTYPAFNPNVIEKSKILLPPLPYQQRIVSVLSAYDDLIEVNNKRIALLEQMAEQIYKEWFRRMRFPGYENTEFERGVPKSWIIKKVAKLIIRKGFGNTYNQDKVLPNGKVIVIDQSRNDILGFHNNDADHQASTNNPMIIFGDHTCKMQMMVEPFSLGENVIPFIGNQTINIYYLYYVIHSLVETSEYKRHWNELIIKSVFIPEIDLQEKFGEIVKPMLSLKNQLWHTNLVLKQTRDLLLPRLISGKLRVKNVSYNNKS